MSTRDLARKFGPIAVLVIVLLIVAMFVYFPPSGKMTCKLSSAPGDPHAEYTYTVLFKLWKVKNVETKQVITSSNKELLKRMAQCAEIGNHGYLHRDHATISEQANKEEILLCHKLVFAVTKIEMDLFAPPSGSYSDVTLDVCEKNGYKVIMWSKDTIDWRDRDKDLIYKRATSDVKGGDLILMHPTEETVKALPKIIAFYKEKNLFPSTVSDVIGIKGYL